MLVKESSALASLAQFIDNNLAVSFSGGKDSLVVLDLAQRLGFKKAVFVNTTIEFEQTLQYIKSIEDFYSIKIDTVSAPVDFIDMIKHTGIPTRLMRWCCDVFKFGPLAAYARKNKLDGFITGLRRMESNKRVNYKFNDINPLVPVKQINPILDWSDEDVWGYIKAYNLPTNPLYQYLDRIGCWCCPYRSSTERRRIAKIIPKKIQQFEIILQDFAHKLKIKNKKHFVKKEGWVSWSTPLKKRSIGIYSPCQGNNSNNVNLIFSGENEEQITKISQVLPILTNDFFAINHKLRINIKNINRVKLNILIEKAINCVGCGACITLCEFGALRLKKGSIYVDENKCTKCQRCINTHPLRGACVIRNYSPLRSSLVGF
ncbi:MAG: phosphoadenosine phosphosulfate reductase domain-containing protein [Candidatus Ranarchaeia archaeon]